MQYYVYILANHTNVAIYIGVTNHLIRRVWEHKQNFDQKSFTARYNIHKLVYFEIYHSSYEAISREKQLKDWNRAKKNKLISEFNPSWSDLYDAMIS